ncbi:hypothetical protein [Coxiella burnetii]|uniref:hypothetical protein n=1 Tax=Coxiella burnetii TaxID=777 RepID=UPI0005095D6B|nr:hypothetical protein [Coxiella burnetii]
MQKPAVAKEPLLDTGKRWKARLIVGFIMLALAFISLFIMEIQHAAYWVFTCIMSAIDAVLCVWLVWYLKRQGTPFLANSWHITLHWIGLIAAVYLIAVFIKRGIVSHQEAGLFTLLLLALTLYLAGIYTDIIFLLIGVALGILTTGVILVKAYVWLIMIPIILLTALIIFFIVSRDRKKLDNEI